MPALSPAFTSRLGQKNLSCHHDDSTYKVLSQLVTWETVRSVSEPSHTRAANKESMTTALLAPAIFQPAAGGQGATRCLDYVGEWELSDDSLLSLWLALAEATPQPDRLT